MALCPFADHLLIPAGSNDPRITPRLAILHVDAGNASSLYTFFRDRSGGIESHFLVAKRKDPNRPGRSVIEQYRDTDYEADANYHANPFAISIETQGFGPGEWTPEQLASIQELLLWCHEEHPIPLRKADRWDGSGIGYHIQFGSPGAWTPVSKSCPGPDRIKQFNNTLVPWMSNPTEKDWFDMAEKADLREVVDNAIKAATPEIAEAAARKVMASQVTHVAPDGKTSKVSLATILKWVNQRGQRIEQKVADAGKAPGA